MASGLLSITVKALAIPCKANAACIAAIWTASLSRTMMSLPEIFIIGRQLKRLIRLGREGHYDNRET